MTDEATAKPPIGRPTDYRPEYCAKVIEWGRQGKSKTWMAANLDIVRETLDDWAKANPEFSDALTRAVQHSQAYWEDKGHDNLATAGFQGNMWGRNMAARFPRDWRETAKTIQSGDPDAPIKHEGVLRIEQVIVDPPKYDED